MKLNALRAQKHWDVEECLENVRPLLKRKRKEVNPKEKRDLCGITGS